MFVPDKVVMGLFVRLRVYHVTLRSQPFFKSLGERSR